MSVSVGVPVTVGMSVSVAVGVSVPVLVAVSVDVSEGVFVDVAEMVTRIRSIKIPGRDPLPLTSAELKRNTRFG